MVNLVLVSHSEKLAQGLSDILQQMAGKGCKVAVAAGIDDPENPIGTDATKIMAAVEDVYSPDGVVIFADLGSAILSAETALDLLDPVMAENVVISFAPLVEGAFAAAVCASSGDNLQTVLAEAEDAAALKLSQGEP